MMKSTVSRTSHAAHNKQKYLLTPYKYVFNCKPFHYVFEKETIIVIVIVIVITSMTKMDPR